MEKYFALINNSLVVSVAVGDDSFLSHIDGKYDLVVDVTNRDRPMPGDSYYSNIDSFISNSIETIHIPVDLSAAHLNSGTEKGFEPFNISKYSVRYDKGTIQIGCKKYSAPGFMDALHKILIEKETTVHCFDTSKGPTHGKFEVTWDDVKKLYEALKKVRL